MPEKIILDCDPGHDDAIAILLACASPELEVRGITTVAGNVSLEKTSTNALKVCELGNIKRIPVYAGMSGPLVRRLETAEHVHGKSGMDGPELPEPELKPAQMSAVDFIISELINSAEPITLVPTGPLTNIAMAILHEPRIVPKIKEIVSMGGALYEGNITPSAEFNIYVDPHAARIVYSCGAKVTMIGLNLTHQALATPERIARIKSIGTKVSETVVQLLDFYFRFHRRRYTLPGPPLHDPCAVAAVIDRSLIKTNRMYVDIETTGELTIGRTVCDVWGVTGKQPNAEVGMSIDDERFFDLLIERLAGYR